MKKIYTIILLAVFGFTSYSHAQQFPYFYQYLMNRYSLSPAYAGLSGDPEGYLSYRQNRINVNYTPKTLDFNFNTPISPKVGLGLMVINDKADIFNNLYALASYTYHLQLTENQFLDFSLAGGLNQKSIDLSGAADNPLLYNDPLINGRTQINATSLELGGALLYRYKSFNLGVTTPSFYENNTSTYAFVKHFIGHASYDFKLNDSWNMEPIALVRLTDNSPVNFDVSAFFRYKEKLWFGPTFKRNTILALSIGGLVTKNVVFMYSYDMHLPNDQFVGVLGDNYGGHEITLGYRFGKHAVTPGGLPVEDNTDKLLKTKARSGQVDTLSQIINTLNDQVKKLADSLSALKKRENQPQNADFSGLEDQIKKLNEKLLKVSGAGDEIVKIAKTVYFEFNKSTITKYSTGKLDDLAELLKKYPTFRLTIEGHTDNVGTTEYNQALSERRVESVIDYLVKVGIERSRLSGKGYGETRPIATNSTDEGRQMNRRVEMTGY